MVETRISKRHIYLKLFDNTLQHLVLFYDILYYFLLFFFCNILFCKVGIRRGWNGATEYARRRENAGKRKCGRRGKVEMRKARESGKAECDRIVGRWMNGRGVTERRTDGRKEGRADGRKEGRTDGKKDGQKEGQMDGRKDRRMEGRTDRRNILRRCERLGLSLCAVPSLHGTVCVFLFGRVGVTERA